MEKCTTSLAQGIAQAERSSLNKSTNCRFIKGRPSNLIIDQKPGQKDKISIKDLHEKTSSLTYNQLVIQATQRLTEAILKGDCSGLMDFYSTEEQQDYL
jgi:hypothetical protein